MEATKNKVLLKAYDTYGKLTGDELVEYVVLDRDDEDTLRDYYDDLIGEDVEGDFESFLNGETIYWSIYDEWDSPTGGYMYIVSYAEELETITNEYNRQLTNLNKKFGIK